MNKSEELVLPEGTQEERVDAILKGTRGAILTTVKDEIQAAVVEGKRDPTGGYHFTIHLMPKGWGDNLMKDNKLATELGNALLSVLGGKLGAGKDPVAQTETPKPPGEEAAEPAPKPRFDPGPASPNN